MLWVGRMEGAALDLGRQMRHDLPLPVARHPGQQEAMGQVLWSLCHFS